MTKYWLLGNQLIIICSSAVKSS